MCRDYRASLPFRHDIDSWALCLGSKLCVLRCAFHWGIEGIGGPELSVPMAADKVQLLLGGFDNFSVLSARGSRAVFMLSREGSMAVGASSLLGAVRAGGPNMEVEAGAAVVAT